jgi:hypothetical protein
MWYYNIRKGGEIMKKFPVWLIIVAVLSLFPYLVFCGRYPDNDLILNIISVPLGLLVTALFYSRPLLVVAYLITVIIRVYFLGKLVYGLFHKFNIRISDKAKYVLPSMLAVSVVMFFAAMAGMPDHLSGF